MVPVSGRVVHISDVGIHGDILKKDQPWNQYKNGSLSLNFENEWKWNSIELVKFTNRGNDKFKAEVMCSGWEQCGIPSNLLKYNSQVKFSTKQWENHLKLS